MTYTSYQIQCLLDDPGVGGTGIQGTDLIVVTRDFDELTDALKLLTSLNNNPMASCLVMLGTTESGDTITMYNSVKENPFSDVTEELGFIIDSALGSDDIEHGYRVAYTDRYDGRVETRCQFFDNKADVQSFADQYFDLNNDYNGINHGFCRPEALSVAEGAKAWDMEVAGQPDNTWEVSFPEDSYVHSYEIPDPHMGEFEYSNIRRTHAVSTEINEDGSISIPLALLM